MRSLNVKNILVGVCVGALIIVLGGVYATAQGTGLQVLRVLQNENNPDVIAIAVFGIFQENDVLNIYTNDVFIKAKIIVADDVHAEGAEVQVGDISSSVLTGGENNITAQVERQGLVVQRSPALLLRVQDTPVPPSITITPDAEDENFAIDLSGSFADGDTLIVFLNGNEIRTKVLTADEAAQGTVTLPSVSLEELAIGENTFEALVSRGSVSSERAAHANPIVREVPEPEPEPEPEPLVIISPECVDYTVVQKVYEKMSDPRTHFGRSVSIAGNTLVVGTDKNRSVVYQYDGTGVDTFPNNC